jgi:hypothetical protein
MGCLYSLRIREEVFSETYMQLIERLCAKAPETPRLPSRKTYDASTRRRGLYEYAGAQVFAEGINSLGFVPSHGSDTSMRRLVLRALLNNDGTREVRFE